MDPGARPLLSGLNYPYGLRDVAVCGFRRIRVAWDSDSTVGFPSIPASPRHQPTFSVSSRPCAGIHYRYAEFVASADGSWRKAGMTILVGREGRGMTDDDPPD
jgi:hypothetical protein